MFFGNLKKTKNTYSRTLVDRAYMNFAVIIIRHDIIIGWI